MTPSDSLTYVIKFRDSPTCSWIERAQPGEGLLKIALMAGIDTAEDCLRSEDVSPIVALDPVSHQSS
jgi:hypothetical protein